MAPWIKALSEKLTVSHLAKKFLELYGIRRFIIAFTSARYSEPVLSQMNPVQILTSYFFKIHFNITCLCFPSGLLSSGFSQKKVRICVFFRTCHILNLITRIFGEDLKIAKLLPVKGVSFCSYLPFLGAFAELRKETISFVTTVRLSVCLSVCLSACKHSASIGRIFMKFNILRIFRKSVEGIQVSLKPDT
jgi:hypothetical protein